MPDNATELLERPAGDAADVADGIGSESADADADEIIAADLLVEEISIDGMCGVY